MLKKTWINTSFSEINRKPRFNYSLASFAIIKTYNTANKSKGKILKNSDCRAPVYLVKSKDKDTKC